MGCRIKMQGIHDIFLILDGILRHDIHILGPGRRSHDDNGFFVIFPDQGDHLGSIGFDILFPGDVSVGLIADLVQDIGLSRILFGEMGKEIFRLLLIGLWISVG